MMTLDEQLTKNFQDQQKIERDYQVLIHLRKAVTCYFLLRSDQWEKEIAAADGPQQDSKRMPEVMIEMGRKIRTSIWQTKLDYIAGKMAQSLYAVFKGETNGNCFFPNPEHTADAIQNIRDEAKVKAGSVSNSGVAAILVTVANNLYTNGEEMRKVLVTSQNDTFFQDLYAGKIPIPFESEEAGLQSLGGSGRVVRPEVNPLGLGDESFEVANYRPTSMRRLRPIL